MINVNDYIYYVYVVEKKGFSSAERALGIPKSRLSRRIRELEDRLGVRLIQRNSRRFVITDIGKTFYQYARAALDEIEAAEALVKNTKNEISGTIRITCSIGVAQFALKKLIADFLQEYPLVKIVQHVTNANIDLIKEGFDLAIRGYEETLPDSNLVQRTMTNISWALVASPDYINKTSYPKTPEELSNHTGLKVGTKMEPGTWNLRHNDGTVKSVTFAPKLCSDDMVTLIEAAKAGLGIVALPKYVSRSEVQAGTLTYLLPDWSLGDAIISLLSPSRQGVLPEVAVFSGFLLKEFPKIVEGRE